ncbi:MAG: hypothetical protein ACI8WB_002419 [Phenylobacterium sp.]|jgi:hypothetical protein
MSNKQNLQYFENTSMKGLYDNLSDWQDANKQRFLSMDIQKEDHKYCCIALTNPSEVVIVARNHENADYQEIYRLADEEVFAKDSFSPHTEISHSLSVKS